MVDSSTISIFVPVLILIVIEISQAAREFDLQKISSNKQEPFFYSIFYFLERSQQEMIHIPQLGPFNFIHGMNLGILYLGYTLTITTSTGTTQIMTGLIVYLFWVVFPMIEVNEYVAIMDDPDIGPISFLYHSLLTTISAVTIFLYGSIITEPTELLQNKLELAGFVLVVLVLFYVSLIGYLTLLERELESTQGDLLLLENSS